MPGSSPSSLIDRILLGLIDDIFLLLAAMLLVAMVDEPADVRENFPTLSARQARAGSALHPQLDWKEVHLEGWRSYEWLD